MNQPTYHQTTEGEMGFMELCNGTVSHWTPDWHEYDENAHACDCPHCEIVESVHRKVDTAIPFFHVTPKQSGTGHWHCEACGNVPLGIWR